MSSQPLQPSEEEKVYEAEIVGAPPPRPPFWQRILSRLFMVVFLVLTGAGLCVVGVVLTLTVVGALAGIPLILVGLGLMIAAFFLPLGGGSVKFQTFRRGRFWNG